MKRIFSIALVSVTLAAGAAHAQSAEVKRACDAVNTLAPLVMQQRQAGAPMQDILPYADMAQGPVKALVQDMIRDAYTVPAASGGAVQQAINDFQRRWVNDCYASYQ